MPTERVEIAALRAEVQTNRGECDRRHRDVGADLRRIKDVQIAHDRRLVAISGEGGKNGMIGELQEDVKDHGQRINALEIRGWKFMGALAVLMLLMSLAGSSLGVYLLSAAIGGGG